MKAPIAMVCVELLVAMTGLRTIAEASTEARTGFLRVDSRAKVSDLEKDENWFVSNICLWEVGVE